jgi:HemY protein
MLAPPRREPPAAVLIEPAPPAAQDNSPAAVAEQAASPPPASSSPPAEPAATPPMFRARQDVSRSGASAVPPVIPIVRAPDDPGVDDEPPAEEFAEQTDPAQAQAGGWRGFLSRWGG